MDALCAPSLGPCHGSLASDRDGHRSACDLSSAATHTSKSFTMRFSSPIKLRAILLAGVILLSRQGYAAAEIAGRQALEDGDLDEIHAAYADPSGLNMSLGAVMKSYVD